MGKRSRPSSYKPVLPFHIIRLSTFVSVLIVGGILGYFCAQLTQDNFKLPWTFLVMLLADVFLLVSLSISTAVYFCAHLSPLLNMIVNIPILLLWTVGTGLLVWNMYGTLGNSCDAWGNNDGKKVCHEFKTLFSFVIIGWLCQIALIVLDVRARRNQNTIGRYSKMDGDGQDLKLNALDHSRNSSVQSVHNVPLGTGLDGAAQRMNGQEHGAVQRTSSQRGPGPVRHESFYSSAPSYTTQPSQPTYQDNFQQNPYVQNQPTYQAYNPNANTRFEPTYGTGHVSMSDFDYQRPTPQTRYDNYYSR